MSKPFFVATPRTKPARTADADAVAARYLVYELFDLTDRIAGAWHVLGKIAGPRQAALATAVERGWVITGEVGLRNKMVSATLTNKGRLVARRGLV